MTTNSEYLSYLINNKNDICHYGIPRKSGRYPWGSGGRPFQSQEGKKKGLFRRRKKTQEREEENLTPEERQRRREAEKERILKEGTATEILQIQEELTSKELAEALGRIQTKVRLREISQKELDASWNKIDSVMKKVGKINDWTSTGIKSVKNSEEILKMLDDFYRRAQQARGGSSGGGGGR